MLLLSGKCVKERDVRESHYGEQHVTKAERERSGETITQQNLLPVIPHSSGTRSFGKAGLPGQVNNVMSN